VILTLAGLTLTMLGSLSVWAFWGYRARRSFLARPALSGS